MNYSNGPQGSALPHHGQNRAKARSSLMRQQGSSFLNVSNENFVPSLSFTAPCISAQQYFSALTLAGTRSGSIKSSHF
jgi:hypothetical protein